MITRIHRYVIPQAYSFLPAEMASDRATAMLLAIGLQESRFRHRRQISGPARGFWQFEFGGGLLGVLTHTVTRPIIEQALMDMQYPTNAASAAFVAIEHNDVLAAVFARLLLWTLPDPLAGRSDLMEAWSHYVAAWRPGKPHPETWDEFYAKAWSIVDGGQEA